MDNRYRVTDAPCLESSQNDAKLSASDKSDPASIGTTREKCSKERGR